MADDSPPQVLRAAIKLGKTSRGAAFILGLAGLGSGGAAVFITHLEAGPVALIAAGLLLALVGLAGVLPTRLKVGDNEIEFQQRQIARALQESVEDASGEDAKKEAAAVVERVAQVAPQVAAPAQRAYEYQQEIVGMFAQLPPLSSNQVVEVSVPEPSLGHRFDAAVIVEPHGGARPRHVLLEIRSAGTTTSAVDRLLRGSESYAEAHRDADVVLLFITPYVTVGARHVIERLRGVYLAVVTDRAEHASLRRAFRDALAGPPIRVVLPDETEI